MPPLATLLIIDDDANTQLAFQALLAQQDYELIFADDALEGLRLAARYQPDIILLDVMLPSLDGFEVCRQLRANPRLAAVPILMLTALAQAEARLEGLRAGADDFITKPFDGPELLARLQTIARLNRYRRLHERDAELLTLHTENERLAQKAAEAEVLREVDRLRSELIANVSHELRTPLGLILVLCTTLLREDAEFDRATQRDFLHDIETEARSLQQMVDHLLDLARLQSRQVALERKPTRLDELTRQVVTSFAPLLAGRLVTCHFPEPHLTADVDASQLEQVLRNLLSNAIKYTPPGTPLQLQGWREGAQACLAVQDAGPGIPPEEREKIFERFYRLDNPATRNVSGIGLGLPICRAIVAAHAGRIWVEDPAGGGSRFCLALPVRAAIEPEPAP